MGFKDSKLVKDTATLVSGNVAAQAIALAAYFVLTRIYTPDDFGLFNIFYSYIEVLIILSTCKYELAILVADDEEESAATAAFALRMNAAVSLLLLTMAAVLYLCHALPERFAELGFVVLLIPPMVFLCGTSRVYGSLFNRVCRYRTIAGNAITNSVAGAVGKIVLGLLGLHRSGLPLGTLLGQATANIAYRLQLRKMHLPDTSRQQQLAAAKRHRNFPFYVATKDFVNSFSANLPFLWLAFWFDKAEVGLLGLALTFVLRPVNLVNSAVERVLYARIAEQVRQRAAIASTIRKYLLTVAAIAFPLFVALWFLAEPAFTLLFGSRWAGCSLYVQALLPWVFLTLGSTPLTLISNVFSTQKTEFFFHVALLALRAAAIATGIATGNFLLAVILYATAGALVAASLLVWYLWQVHRYERLITN